MQVLREEQNKNRNDKTGKILVFNTQTAVSTSLTKWDHNDVALIKYVVRNIKTKQAQDSL